MWTHLEPHSAKLEQVFQPLRERAAQFRRMWSIAELRLEADEVIWLRSWFECLTPKSTENWISVLLARVGGEAFRSYRQMFGALLICAGAEVCREESNEDSVWPAIRKILPKSHPLRHELFFSNGQPSSLTKEVIADAVRALNLRSAMDIEGTQQWFVTIKLQFGFTHRGARNRLAEWLVNLGRPHAVQYLDGDSEFSELSSQSFQSLWRALRQYRRDLIQETEIRRTLHENPWIKAHWIDGLLTEARGRIATLGTGESGESDTTGLEEQAVGEELCPLLSIGLEWPPNKAPRLSLLLDRAAIEDRVAATTIGELDFYVDGKKRTRWLCQRDGSWVGDDRIFAEPEKEKETPNLSPCTLAVQNRSGEILAEWDLADSGLSDEVLVFDLDKGNLANARSERLQPNRSYAIVCGRKCEIQGCDPVEVFERNRVAKKVLRLAPPLAENLCITYGDFVLWQPVREEKDHLARFGLTLSTPGTEILSLRDRSKLLLEGLPQEAESVELLIHTKTYALQKEDGRWSTVKDITITPELAARQRRVRVRFSLDGRSTTQEPRLALDLLGAAMLRQKWEDNEKVCLEPVPAGSTVNRSEGTVYLRVWVPGENKRASFFEESCQAGRLRYSRLRLQDLPGHGGELQIQSEETRYSLGIACVDNGCIGGFLPGMMQRTQAQLRLSSEKDPLEVRNEGYALFQWKEQNHQSKIGRLPPTDVGRNSTKRLWRLRYSSNPLAIALAWKGVWKGSWWNLQPIGDYVERRPELRESDFALVKWLRVPILHPTISSVFKRAVLRTPCRFIKTWLNDDGLPEGLSPHEHILGLDSVIRYFLWNDFPVAHAPEALTLAGRWLRTYQKDRCLEFLDKLSGISPILLWKGMEQCVRCYALKIGETRDLLNAFSRAQVGLPSRSSKQEVDYRLRAFSEQARRATGISEERLERITHERFRSMMKKSWHPPEEDSADLLMLGEARSGRTYFSVRMALHWLDLACR